MVASEEYVRTSRQVVFTIQKAVNRAIVTGYDHEYFEDEAIDRLCKAAEALGATPTGSRRGILSLPLCLDDIAWAGCFPHWR